MRNVFFPDEEVTTNDLYFVCYMVERIARKLKQPGEDYADGMLRTYNHPICETIDNYNCSAYYEPSYVQARSYWNGGF